MITTKTAAITLAISSGTPIISTVSARKPVSKSREMILAAPKEMTSLKTMAGSQLLLSNTNNLFVIYGCQHAENKVTNNFTGKKFLYKLIYQIFHY